MSYNEGKLNKGANEMSHKADILKFIVRTKEELITSICSGKCNLKDASYVLRHCERMISNVHNKGWLNQARSSLIATFCAN